MENMGKCINNLRRERGVTQKELGDAVGVSVQAVSKWEHGGAPDIELIPRIAEFFGVSIGVLFGKKGENTAKLDELVFERLLAAEPEERVMIADDIMWAVLRGVSGFESYRDAKWAANDPFSEKGTCTRCRLDYDGLIANACVTDKARYYFLFPEPDEGYGSVLLSTEEYAKLFAILADRELLDVFLFAAGKHETPFSAAHVSQYTGIEEKRVREKLELLSEYNQVSSMMAAVDTGILSLYRFNTRNIMLVPTLLFIRELMYPAVSWHLSGYGREKPIIADRSAAGE